MKNLDNLEEKLNLKFKDKNLLKQALVHRSYLNEHPNFSLDNNERLEFLGDAVLELITTKFLYENFKNPEGELTAFRSSLVNTDSLSKTADELGLNECLFLSRGEQKSTSRSRKVILANTFEALIGAIYLDQGLKSAEGFIRLNLLIKLDVILKKQLYKDSKSELQELIQAKLKLTPTYKVIKEIGPDHSKIFTVGVFCGEKLTAIGRGKSKSEAEKEAAKKALKGQSNQQKTV
jgi:ribonuclease-3